MADFKIALFIAIGKINCRQLAYVPPLAYFRWYQILIALIIYFQFLIKMKVLHLRVWWLTGVGLQTALYGGSITIMLVT